MEQQKGELISHGWSWSFTIPANPTTVPGRHAIVW